MRGNSEGPIEAYLLSDGTSVRTLKIGDDGGFETTHLRPGRYTICARSRTSGGEEAAAVTVDLSSDLTGLILALTPTASLAGRVVTDDGSPLPSNALQVAAVLAVEGKAIDPLRRDRAEVGGDGSFELRGLVGERVVQVVGLSAGWTVQRVMSRKETVELLHIEPNGDIRDLLIVLTRR